MSKAQRYAYAYAALCLCLCAVRTWMNLQASEPPNRNLQRAGVCSSKATTTVFICFAPQQAATNLVKIDNQTD